MRFLPALSLICLLLARTALHSTRCEDGALGFGMGTLFAFVVSDIAARLLPGSMPPKRPEDSDLQTFDLPT